MHDCKHELNIALMAKDISLMKSDMKEVKSDVKGILRFKWQIFGGFSTVLFLVSLVTLFFK